MQVNETLNDGLARELTITVAKKDMESQLVDRLEKMKNQVQINGFRQGKVPISHLRKIYGKQAMAEIVNEFINTRSGEVLKDRGEKPAQQPQVSMTEDDREGVQCAICHRMVDPVYSSDNPVQDIQILNNLPYPSRTPGNMSGKHPNSYWRN